MVMVNAQNVEKLVDGSNIRQNQNVCALMIGLLMLLMKENVIPVKKSSQVVACANKQIMHTENNLQYL